MIILLFAHAASPALATADCAPDTDQHSQTHVAAPHPDAHAGDRLHQDTTGCGNASHANRDIAGQKQATGTPAISTPLVPLVPVYQPVDPGVGQIGPADLTPVLPSLTFSASPESVAPGASAQLVWNAQYVSNCTDSDSWSGRLPSEGSQATPSLSENTTYTITCSGPLGTVARTITVGISGGTPAPVITFTAAPTSVEPGQSSTLSWTTSNTSVCTSSGAWSGPRPLSGSASTGNLADSSQFTLACVGAGGTASQTVAVTVDSGPLPPAPFNKETIALDRATWGKGFADINGDGLLDIIEGGGAQSGKVFWYRNPDWQRFQIGGTSGGDDIKAGDINNDGALDIVVSGNPLSWYENPAGSGGNPQGGWTRRQIANYRAHDLILEDMDGDGKLDVIVRIADTAFPTTRVHLQGPNNSWTIVKLWEDTSGPGGMAVGDIDRDGRPDVVSDGYWLRQPAPADMLDGNNWTRYNFASWPAGSSVSIADINNDGRDDISVAVAEVGTGEFAWFEAPENPLTQSWVRHTIDIVDDVHRHHLVDMNNDGELDIVFAEMFQSDTDRVGVYYNQGDGDSWILDILETHASHNLAIGDVDNDGDVDFVGANWRLEGPADGDLFLWRNLSAP